MQDNFITKVSPSVRIITLLLLILGLLFAKSIYLILSINVLTLILIIITNKKVNIYVNMFKKISILLLILLVTYIIIFAQSNIIFAGLFGFKLITISIIIKIFILNTNFQSLHEGIYGVILPFNRLNINVKNFSLDAALSIYFIKFLIESKRQITSFQELNGKKTMSLKKNFFPRIIYSINQLENLQENLKIKFYKLNYKKNNIQSNLILIIFLILFAICIFKEVIL